MLHDQLRAARIKAGLSQVQLAQRANVQRRRLRAFENGGNVTLETLAKLLEQLPDVHTLDFGGVEIRVPRSDQRDLRELREAMAGLAAGAKRAIELLDRLIGEPVDVAPPAPEPAAADTGPAGATRFQFEGSLTEQRSMEKAQKIAERMRREEELEKQRTRTNGPATPRKNKDQ